MTATTNNPKSANALATWTPVVAGRLFDAIIDEPELESNT
jgi:hypothetical protein